jgi:F0F1-type ATP synthase gamma subunit
VISMRSGDIVVYSDFGFCVHFNSSIAQNLFRTTFELNKLLFRHKRQRVARVEIILHKNG